MCARTHARVRESFNGNLHDSVNQNLTTHDDLCPALIRSESTLRPRNVLYYTFPNDVLLKTEVLITRKLTAGKDVPPICKTCGTTIKLSIKHILSD